jgi:hypothetical protein
MRMRTLGLQGLLAIFALALVTGRAFTEESSPNPRALKDRLIEEIAPEDGPIRPPYDLARHDLGLVPQPGVERTEECLRRAARDRQERLGRTWAELKPELDGLRRTGAEGAADSSFLAYAFGDEPLDGALAAAGEAGPAARFRLARLLLAECRFDEAVHELAALADGKDEEARHALVELARHAEERRGMAGRAQLVPLRLDLEAWLARKSRDKATAALVASARSAVVPRLAPKGETVEPARKRDIFLREAFTSDGIEGPLDTEPRERGFSGYDAFRQFTVAPQSLDRTWLATSSIDLVLYRRRDGIIAGSEAVVGLYSSYCGPLAFRLYRFDDRGAWEDLTPQKLAQTEPVRAWSQTFLRLSDNNSEPGPWQERSIPIKDLAEGYYLVTCTARYAPQLAVQKFCVSRTALYLRVGANLAVAAALDRRTGARLPNMPVELDIAGSPDAVQIVNRFKPDMADAFRAGFVGASPPMPDDPARQAPGALLKLAAAHAEGKALREKYPETRRSLHGRTGNDGTASFPLDLTRSDYVYTLLARQPGKGLAEVTVSYRQPPEQEDVLKTVVWCDQPIYRPGSTMHFKGMVRRFNGLRVAPHDAAWKSAVDVEILSAKGETFWRGRCELSPAGAFKGDLFLPLVAPLGEYRFMVDGRRADPWAPFAVEEFRLPTFRCWMSLDRKAYRAGEKAVGTVEVQYFFGKPVDAAVIEVVLETGEENPPTRTVITGADGRAKFEFTAPQIPYKDGLPIRATVADTGGQGITSTGYMQLTETPFWVRADVQPSPAVRGTPVEIHVGVGDWASPSNPVAGAAVTVVGCGRAAVTDTNGRAVILAKTATQGDSQSFSVSASDGKEAVHTSCSVRLQEPVEGAVLPSDRPAHRDYLSLYCRECDCGKPLSIDVSVDNALEQESTVLLFVENTRLLAFRALSLAPGKHELNIPTDIDFTPSVHVSAFAFNGRSQLTSSYSQVAVRPLHQFLSVHVLTDKDEYRPGERCIVGLLATDHRDQPVPRAEISLGVIHEGVYSLRSDRTPDLRDYYWGRWLPAWPQGHYDCPPPRCPPLVWFRGPKYAWGYLGQGMDCLVSGGGCGGCGRFGGSRATERSKMVPIRKDFRTDAHWVANLVTDRDGRARTEFVFPDDITEWRFTARGLTADTRVGEIRTGIKTLLPLQVELVLPRALRSGDRIAAAALVHNNKGPERNAALAFSANGKEGHANLTVPAGGTCRIDVPMDKASGDMVKFTAQVRDTAGEDADAIERTCLVAPRGYRVSRVFSGLVRDGGTVPFALGGALVPGSLRVSVAIEPGLAGPVESALDGLIGYPYGCVEQTMSRFMPAVVAARAMKAAQLDNPRAGELPDIFDQGLARLAGFQHVDGGWGWWQADRTSDFMTAYVIEGLALCRAAGHPVPAGMLDRAEQYLAARFIEAKLSGQNVGAVGDADIRIFAAHALGTCYVLEPERHADAARSALAALARVKPPEGQAWSARDAVLRADALRLLGDRPAAEAAIKELAGDCAVTRGDRRSILAAATRLELGAALSPADGRWGALARRLVEARRGSGWGDTLASAAAVRGLAAMLSAAPGECGPVEVLLDGRAVATLTPERGSRATVQTDELGAGLAGARELTLRAKRPEAAGFWSARVEGWLVSLPAPPANPEVRLACRYFQVVPERAEIPVGSDGRFTVAPGTTVEVRLECELVKPLSYLRLSFPRPCGVELVQRPDFAKSRLVAFEERDDALHFFADAWEAGRHEVRFLVRPECAGEVFAPPPEVEPMYGDAVPVSVRAAATWAIAR